MSDSSQRNKSKDNSGDGQAGPASPNKGQRSSRYASLEDMKAMQDSINKLMQGFGQLMSKFNVGDNSEEMKEGNPSSKQPSPGNNQFNSKTSGVTVNGSVFQAFNTTT